MEPGETPVLGIPCYREEVLPVLPGSPSETQLLREYLPDTPCTGSVYPFPEADRVLSAENRVLYRALISTFLQILRRISTVSRTVPSWVYWGGRKGGETGSAVPSPFPATGGVLWAF
jgi:hypothetical protein